MSSLLFAMHPLLACFVQAEEKAGGVAGDWHSDIIRAQEFIEHYLPHKDESGKIPELESRVADNAKEINDWLRERGFSIELPENGHLYLASILDLMVKWLKKGVEHRMVGNYKGVFLDKKSADVIHCKNWNDEAHVVRMPTQNGDTAYIYVPLGAPSDEFNLMCLINHLVNELNASTDQISTSSEYAGVVFPEVDLSIQTDVSWAEGMTAEGKDGKPLIVTSCKQEVKLKLDTEGATVKAAAAMSVARSMIMTAEPYVVKDSFFFWITRPGVHLPFVYGYIDKSDWLKTKPYFF